jgi:hypothetical protein
MKTLRCAIAMVVAGLPVAGQLAAQTRPASLPLASAAGLELLNVRAAPATWRGKKSVHVTEDRRDRPGPALAIVTDSELAEGTIELMVAGAPAAGAPEGSRGFIGVAFHVQNERSTHRAFYLRPTNGRAEDQLRRNHATQYVNHPSYPWHRLRKEEPGVYESYVDLEPEVWTRMKVVVTATQARLYVNGAEQPALIVNDLKPGPASGRVALWIGQGTDAYFADLTVEP